MWRSEIGECEEVFGGDYSSGLAAGLRSVGLGRLQHFAEFNEVISVSARYYDARRTDKVEIYTAFDSNQW